MGTVRATSDSLYVPKTPGLFSTPPAAFGGRRLVVERPVRHGQFLLDMNEEQKPYRHYRALHRMLKDGAIRAIGDNPESESLHHGDPLQVSSVHFCILSGVGLFANHSCEPSAVVREQTKLYALTDLAVGDEVTYDYSTVMGVIEPWVLECYCGSEKCRGKVAAYWTVPKELRGEAQPWVTRESHVNVKQQLLDFLATLRLDSPEVSTEAKHWPWENIAAFNEVVSSSERIDTRNF